MLLLITHKGWDGKAREWDWAQLQVCVCVCVPVCACVCMCELDCVCESQLCCPSASGLSIWGKEDWGLWQKETPVWGKERCLRLMWKVTKQLYCTWVQFWSTGTLLEYFPLWDSILLLYDMSEGDVRPLISIFHFWPSFTLQIFHVHCLCINSLTLWKGTFFWISYFYLFIYC